MCMEKTLPQPEPPSAGGLTRGVVSDSVIRLITRFNVAGPPCATVDSYNPHLLAFSLTLSHISPFYAAGFFFSPSPSSSLCTTAYNLQPFLSPGLPLFSLLLVPTPSLTPITPYRYSSLVSYLLAPCALAITIGRFLNHNLYYGAA